MVWRTVHPPPPRSRLSAPEALCSFADRGRRRAEIRLPKSRDPLRPAITLFARIPFVSRWLGLHAPEASGNCSPPCVSATSTTTTREYVITTPQDPVPVDQLPRVGELLRAGLAPGRRLLLLPRRAPAPPHALPLQQRPDRRRRPLLLHQRRRRRTGRPASRRSSATLDSLRVPPRPRLHADHRRAQRRAAPSCCSSCRSGTPPRSTRSRSRTRHRRREAAEALLVRRVLPLERLRRQTNYQRNFAPARSRSTAARIYHKTEYRERRNHYAFYHVNAPVAGLRHRPRDASSASTTAWASRRSSAEGRVVATRWPAAGRRSRSHGLDVDARARRGEDLRLHARLRREPARREVGEARASSTRSRRTQLIDAFSTTGAGRRGARSSSRDHWTRLLSNYTVESGDEKLEPDGQHLEPVPVHGHVQHVAQRLVLRDGHRPRHGLPRLEPGPARLRAPGARSARASASSTSPSTQFPDGSAYHQYQPLTKRGNNDVGSGFNDDPLWLIFGRRRLHQGDRRLRASSTSRCRSTTTRRTRRRCSST